MDIAEALKNHKVIEDAKHEKDLAEEQEEYSKRQRELAELKERRAIKLSNERQARAAHQKLIEEEDAVKHIFDAVCKSIEDPTFAEEIVKSIVTEGRSALNLATFEVTYINYNCLPEYYIGKDFIARQSEMADMIYYNGGRFYYKVKSGKFKDWVVKPKTISKGLFVGTTTYFVLEEVGLFWRLLGY